MQQCQRIVLKIVQVPPDRLLPRHLREGQRVHLSCLEDTLDGAGGVEAGLGVDASPEDLLAAVEHLSALLTLLEGEVIEARVVVVLVVLGKRRVVRWGVHVLYR